MYWYEGHGKGRKEIKIKKFLEKDYEKNFSSALTMKYIRLHWNYESFMKKFLIKKQNNTAR